MKRPVGIAILAVVYFVGGVALVAFQVLTARHFVETLERIGPVVIPGQIGDAMFGVFGVAAGVGMIMGRRWGWSLGAFILAFSVVGSANVLVGLPVEMARFDASLGTAVLQCAKQSVRVMVPAFLSEFVRSPEKSACDPIGDR